MIYAPHFITNAELKEAGVTAEQIAKLFHHNYGNQAHTTEITPSGIWFITWVDHSSDCRNTKDYVESKF